jgi:hypothetical protein
VFAYNREWWALTGPLSRFFIWKFFCSKNGRPLTARFDLTSCDFGGEELEILDVSVDRLTFVGGVRDRRELDGLRFNPFVRGQGRAKFPYDYSWYMEDGSILQLAQPNSDVRPMRYEFNPNRWNRASMKDMHVMSILRLMKNVVPTRIDVAIDVVGDDLGRYEWRDMKSRSRQLFQDGVGRLETLYIGAASSDSRLRIYNKKKEREAKGSEIGQAHEHWWRVEAQLRGEEAERFMEINPFSEIAVTRDYDIEADGKFSDYDIRTRAMLFYLEQFPKAITELAPNSRSKYKQLLAATKKQHSETSFMGIYEDSKEKVREIVDEFRNCTFTSFRMENVPDELAD